MLWYYLVNLIEGGDGPQHKGLSQGEDSKEDEVVRSLSPQSLTASQAYVDHKEDDHRHDPEPPVLS